ncbi:MAG: DUF4389 domain-containing protein [Ilumatobacteraceae bacterium]
MAYPATVEIQTPDKMANWRPIGQMFMAIPHLIISYALTALAEACAFISWFAILFTGKQPQGLANIICMALRYQTRTMAYAAFLHDKYPPFEFTSTAADPNDTPVRVNLPSPPESRNRVTVGFRLILAIPVLIFTALILIVSVVCGLIGFFAVLFTGKWPAALRNWVLKGFNATIRMDAYVMLLTDEYPPFSTE